jgi:hypothetical protein
MTTKPVPAASEIANFLGILGGTGRTVTVCDVSENEYTFSTMLPAARQLELAAILDAALSEDMIRVGFNEIQAIAEQATGNHVAALYRMVRAILKADNRAKVLDTLDKLVAKGYPDAPAPASDHFEIQEVLRMLLPFVSRLLHAVSTAGQAVKAAEA